MTQLQERQFTAAERRSLAKSGAAMANGSYPITDEATLSDAIHAVGRGGADHDTIRAHVMKRARALGLMKMIPDNWGAGGALTEAQSLDERLQAVRSAIFSKMMPAPMAMPEMPSDCCEVKDVFDDFAIVEQGKKTFKVPYAIAADGTVTLKDPVEVEETYVPVKEGLPSVSIFESGLLLESQSDPTGRVWDACLIKAGTSGNRRHYPVRTLQAAAPLFENARAFTNHPSRSEMRDRPERDVRDICGWWTGVRWDDSQQGLRGSFHISESADWLRVMLKDAYQRNQPQIVGFSINAGGQKALRPHTDGSELIEAITSVASVDVVTSPGAKGGILSMLEAQREDDDMAVTADEIKAMIQEALAASLPALKESLAPPTPPPAPVSAETSQQIDDLQSIAVQLAESQQLAPRMQELKDSVAALQEAERVAAARVALSEQKQLVRDKVEAASLPSASAGRLRTKLLEAIEHRHLDEAEIDAEVGYMREMIRESGPAAVSWSGGAVSVGEDFNDKFRKGIEGWFSGEGRPRAEHDVDGVPAFKSLAHMDLTWRQSRNHRIDPLAIGAQSIMESLSGSRYDSATIDLRESLTTASWNQVFADVLYKQMLKEYNVTSKYDSWRKIVSEIESVPSFQTRHWMRTGGYNNLSTVAEQATYTSFVSPGDEEISYALGKRGNLEDVTWEMLQDPTATQKISLIPGKMARAAKRTLYTFVWSTLLQANPTMDYDSTALFTVGATHNNSATAALSVSAIQDGYLAMRAQTAYGESQEVLGELNQPRYLVVNAALQGIADRIINPQNYYTAITNAGTDVTLSSSLWQGRLETIVIDIFTGSTCWYLIADPSTVNTIVMGFLNGREEPEMFVQDNPTVGSVFTSDKISYKIRSVFGGDWTDHRSAYRGNV